MSSQLRSRGPAWALTLSRACALHKDMLWGVKLGMLWGTLKSTFCHRSSPNRSYSKKEAYPHIKHDAESLKYSYVWLVSGNRVELRIGCWIGLWASYETTTSKPGSSKGIKPKHPIILCMSATRKTMAAFGRKKSPAIFLGVGTLQVLYPECPRALFTYLCHHPHIFPHPPPTLHMHHCKLTHSRLINMP